MDTRHKPKRQKSNTDQNDLPKRNFDDKIIGGSGLKLNQHGVEFQLLLLSQCLWRVMKEKISDFLLASELPEAEKFDDVVVQYQQDYQSIVRFLQAKHKEGTTDDDLPQITLKDLLTPDDSKEFCILKYFRSFVKVEEKCSSALTIPVFFVGSSIHDFTLLTNIGLEKSLAEECFETDICDLLEDDVLLKIQSDKVKKYGIKLTDNDLTRGLEPLLLTSTDFDELVEFLADCLLLGQHVDGNVSIVKEKEYYHPLVKYVVDFGRDPQGGRRYFGKLKKDFYATRSLAEEDVMKFRNALIHEVAFRNSHFSFKISKSDTNKNKSPAFNSRKRKAVFNDSPLSRMLDEVVDSLHRAQSSLTYFDPDDPLLIEILDFRRKQFTDAFIQGGCKLTPVTRLLRKKVIMKLLNKDVAEKEFKKHSKNEFPCTEGVATQFKLHDVPPMDSPQTLAKDMAQLIQSCQNADFKLDIESAKASDELRESVPQLAGHVLVKVDKSIGFSGRFIRGQFLPQPIKDFRLSLKKLLGNNLFNRLDEYSFINLKGFKCAEESNLHRTLPKQVTNESLESFYEQFRLIAEYPNRKEIRMHLENEVQVVHNNLDSKAFVDSFVQNMWQWLTCRAGTFYTPRKAKQLLQQLDENISCYELDGISQSFFLGLPNEYQFDCSRWTSELEKFMTSDNRILFFSVLNNTIGRVRFMQTIKEMRTAHLTDVKLEIYLRQFGYLFLNFTAFADETFLRKINRRNRDSRKWSLWVVGCNDTMSNSEQFSSMLELCFQNTSEEVHRKLILIVTENKLHQLQTMLTQSLPQRTYLIKSSTAWLRSTFNDLHVVSQKKMFSNAKLKFQKRECKLGDLVNNNTVGLIGEDALDALISVRSGESALSIGNDKEYFESAFDTSCYLDRRICSIVIDQLNRHFKSTDDANIFHLAINDTSKETIILADTREEFNEIKARLTPEDLPAVCSVHWLQMSKDQWIWRDTIGSINHLMEYRQREAVVNTYSEADFLTIKSDCKIVIVYGIPGAGKSLLLSSLFNKSFNTSTVWKLYINLNMYSNFFSKKLHERSDWSDMCNEKCSEFLLELIQSNEHSKLISAFEINLLKSAFIDAEKGLLQLAMFFDGFDEISPNYKEIALAFFQALKRCCSVRQIFITTRPNFCQYLEQELETFGHEINDLSPREQVELLEKLMEKHQLPIVKTEIQTLIQELTRTLPGRQRFTAIPLHIHMLAEVCIRLDHEEIKTWLKNYDPSTLYAKYFEMKHRIFREEKMQVNPTNVSGMEDCRYAYNDFLKRHEKLALWSMYAKDEIALIVQSLTDFEEEIHDLLDDIRAGKYKYGVVFTVVNDSPLFTHRTYAEFMVAHYFVRLAVSASKLTASALKFIVSQMIGRTIYPTRIFFDSLMANKRWTWNENQRFEDIDRPYVVSIRQALVEAYDNNHWGIFNFIWEFLKSKHFYQALDICMETLTECIRSRSYFALFAFIYSAWRKLILVSSDGRRILNSFRQDQAVCWEGDTAGNSNSISYFCTLHSGEWVVKSIPRWLVEHSNFSIRFEERKPTGRFLADSINWHWPDPDEKVKERTLAEEWQPVKFN